MEVHNRKRKAWLQFMAAILLCGVLLIWGLGTAWARYEANMTKAFSLTYKAQSDQIYLRSVEPGGVIGDETEEEDSDIKMNASAVAGNIYEMDFVLSNGASQEAYCTYDQVASLSLFATVGLKNPENFLITLTDGGITYVASCSEVAEGTVLYSLYGPGWVYRFYNAAGEELTWLFPGQQFVEKQMNITVVGTSELPVALNIIASAKPGDI